MTTPIGPRWRQRGPWLIAGILALTVMALVSIRPWGRVERPGDDRPARPAVAVEIATAEPMRLQETVRGMGTLRASAQVELRPEIPGVVRAIRFTEGAPVQQGQVLFELDDQTLAGVTAARQAALRAAETAVEDARRTVERAKLLWARELIARADLDQAQTTLARAVAERDRLRAELAVAQSQRRESRILAPFTGVISERAVDRGAYVTAGQTLASLYQVNPLELELYLSERHLGHVRAGQPVAVAIAAFPDRVFDGRVDFVSPVVREATRDFLVKAEIPNPQGLLRPGAFATARVTVDVRAERPVIPEEALVATRVGYRVFVIDEGIARLRDVRIGLRQDGFVEIVDGLAAGEQIVRAGHLRLAGGEPVRIVNDSPAATPGDSPAVTPGPPAAAPGPTVNPGTPAATPGTAVAPGTPAEGPTPPAAPTGR